MKISFCSLGCKVNQYEVTAIINQFLDEGWELVPFDKIKDINVDAIIINTCSVTDTSDGKSRKMIHRAVKYAPDAIIAVMGCYSQLNSEKVASIKGVSIVIGTSNRDKLHDMILDKLNHKGLNIVNNTSDIMKQNCYEELKVHHTNDKTRAFVKIQDGCNNFCSYCTIPYARGLVRSRNKDNVIEEIQILSNNGVKEIVLTGIDTGSYGKDFDDYDLANLLEDICLNVNNLGRIRISSIENSEISVKLLNVIKKYQEHFCMHLHIPLQGSSDKVLKRMNRKYTMAQYLEKIDLIYSMFPDINITTDILTGFCSEDEEDFLNGLDVIKKAHFGEMHVFPYSRRPKTIAYKYTDQVDEATKHKRVLKILELNEEMALNYRKKFIGKELDVICEVNKDGWWHGHTSNYIEIKFKGDFNSNDLVKVRMTSANYPESIGEVL
ncbi:MAG: tRNA (N(6)-L-threonylcarbamoyladenosine(37)-C(2))-methylthiotransferase MtaB [Bacilli bacterium]|nr:tRNA (N(6)-L-threonylcarbamoyladenosine(37)-C(2))-methylthiotransferase MtaB [Bacilli bacterium]